MAPEYLYRGEISTRSDIYSLGVLIMEIATGQKNSMNDKDMSGRDFVDQARPHIYQLILLDAYFNFVCIILLRHNFNPAGSSNMDR